MATICRYLELVLLMACPAGLQYLIYVISKLLMNAGGLRVSSVFFFNSLVEKLFLISLGRLFQRRLSRNRGEFIPRRVECAGGNVFSFLKSYGEKI